MNHSEEYSFIRVSILFQKEKNFLSYLPSRPFFWLEKHFSAEGVLPLKYKG